MLPLPFYANELMPLLSELLMCLLHLSIKAPLWGGQADGNTAV